MRKPLYILSFFFLILSCSDGDILDVELSFDDSLELCDNFNDSYLLYNIKTDPNESLTLLFPVNNTNNLIFSPSESGYVEELTTNGASIRFNYRTYNGDPTSLICQEIPDANVTITNDYEAANGATANFVSTFVDDDNDGIPSEDEDDNLDGDGDYLTNPTDSDGDGIPNYIDADDDNDNVLTKNEDDNLDGDNNPFTNPLDTDDDTIPNYLDTDDDGDGVLTIYENEDGATETVGNYSLFDDFDEPSDIPRFLDENATDEYMNDGLNPNSYKRTISVEVNILNSSLDILNSDIIEFGTYSREVTIQDN